MVVSSHRRVVSYLRLPELQLSLRSQTSVQHLLTTIKASVAQQNWYAALSVTLALPDICGRLEDPAAKIQDRYVSWFDRFVAANYIPEIGPSHERHVFLSGRDCYALRCAFLHEGRDEISSQRAHEALERFKFAVTPPGTTVHCNKSGSKLQLQVDIFCLQFVAGGEAWYQQIGTRPEVEARMSSLLRIYDVYGNSVA